MTTYIGSSGQQIEFPQEADFLYMKCCVCGRMGFYGRDATCIDCKLRASNDKKNSNLTTGNTNVR